MPKTEIARVPRRNLDILSIACSCLILAGILLRIWVKRPTDLWEDEIIATTHAVQPLWAVLVSTVRHDIHPPLYFIQLHIWSLLGSSDLWFMANSIGWSFLGLGSLAYVTRALYGKTAAWAITATYAVLPSPVYMSDQVRMYAMLAALLIWAFYFAHLVFWTGRKDKRTVATLILLQAAIILTHALGAFAAGLIGLYALCGSRLNRHNFGIWALCYSIVVLIGLPVALNAMVHDGNIRDILSLQALMAMCSSAAVGPMAERNIAISIAGLVIFAFCIIPGVRNRDSRYLTLFFLLTPLLVVTVSAFVLKPFLKWNFLSTIAGPFVAIILGLVATQGKTGLRFLAVLCLAALFVVSITERASFRTSSRFRITADFLRANYRPGDVILAPQDSYFHGIAWYLIGPYWGSPLEIAPRPSEAWSRVYAKLGPNLMKRLHLMPKTQILSSRGFTLDTGPFLGEKRQPERIWLVLTPRGDLPKGYPPEAFGALRRQQTLVNGIAISLYSREPAPPLPLPETGRAWTSISGSGERRPP